MKVQLIGPSRDAHGGVAAYCNLMAESLPVRTIYHQIGRRRGETRGYVTAVRLCADAIRYLASFRQAKPDIIHFNPSLNLRSLLRDGMLIQLSRISPARKLVFIHGWDNTTAQQLKQRSLLRRLFLRAVAPADGFIVLCHEFRDALLDIGVRVPVYVETVAVADRAGRTETAGVGDFALRALFLSRIETAKGVFEAIEAHRLLVMGGVRAHLTIAGDGPDLEAARNSVRAQAIPDVSFLGYVDGQAKHDAFSAASVFVFPTRYGEGMPTCVLEAMTYGLPVVTRPVGGIRDFFEEGKMGFLSTDGRPESLARLLQKFVDSPSKICEMGAYNECYAKERFNASRVSGRLVKIYQTLLCDG